jgi:hypothetical protein
MVLGTNPVRMPIPNIQHACTHSQEAPETVRMNEDRLHAWRLPSSPTTACSSSTKNDKDTKHDG